MFKKKTRASNDGSGLRESRYEQLISFAPDPIVILSTFGIIKSMNQAAEKISGYTSTELVGRQFASVGIIAPAYLPKVTGEFLLTLSKKERPAYEVEAIYKNGDRAQLEIHAHLIEYPGEGGADMLVILRDITERRNIDDRMRLQSQALDASANGIVIANRDGVITWVNKAFTKMTGYSFEEAVGNTPRVLKSGEMPPRIYEELWETVLRGDTWTGELINRRKDGTHYFESQTITPIKNDQGKVSYFIAIKQDISANKLLEAQFKQAQKMEAVGRLAGGVAHDFNNLLTVIIGQCDLVLSEMSPDSAFVDNINEIKQSGTRAANLTRQLLAFSRKQIFQTRVVDLNEIVRGADKLLRRLLGEDIEFVTLFGQNMRPIKADPAQIEQIIMNLVVNARDAMPKGGKITIETSEVSMDGRSSSAYLGMQAGEYVLLKVKDTGCGMTPEVQSKIFEPFFTTKDKGKGTGLGLATVYGITKQSRGYIYVQSEVDKGTTFLIFLPVSEETKEAQAGTKSPELPPGKGTILVVEDEELVRRLAVHVLERQGYRILEARTGAEALKVAEEHRGSSIDLLFTDMIMPQMGGNELAEAFSLKYPSTKIIFTSGYSDHSVVQRWIDQGCRFVQKPYTPAELLVIVQNVLKS